MFSDKPSLPPAWKRLVQGTLSGLIATVPMTAAMALMYRLLPARERYPLPPRQVTKQLAKKVGQRELVDTPQEASLATAFGHFGYGAMGGAVYGLTAEPLPLPALLKGPLFGLLVWVLSYLGWLPAFDVLSPATKHPKQRNLLMIAAHLIYGGALALLAARLRIGRKSSI